MHKIITQDLKGYRNHPATKEYEDCPELLWHNLSLMRNEMLKRGWHPKELPERIEFGGQYKEWQTLEEQIDRLKEKGCECRLTIDKLNNDVIMNLVDKMIKNKQIDCFAQIGGYILPFICF